MYCEMCGAKIDDNAKFCPVCGARIASNSPAPAAPEPAGPVPSGFEDQPTVVLRNENAGNAYGQPADNAYNQPAGDAYGQPVYNQQADNAYGQPPYGQPAGNAYGQTGGAPYGQPAYGQPAGGNFGQPPYVQVPETPKKKKSALPIILAIVIGAAAIIGALIFLNKDKAENFVKKTFSAPEKYYEYVETREIGEITGNSAAVYKRLLSYAKDDQSVDYVIHAEVSESLTDMLHKSTGEDFDWIKDVTLSGNFTRKEKLLSLAAAAALNGKQLLSADAVADLADMMVYARVPEISDNWLGSELSELSYRLRNLEDTDVVDDVLNALPDDKTLESLLNKYVGIAIAQLDDVEKESEEVSAEGVSAKYTVLKVKITEKNLQNIAKAVLTELKEDEEVKKILKDITKALDADYDFNDFKDDIEEALDEIDEIELDGNIRMNVYVDGTGEIRGRTVQYDDFSLSIKAPKSGTALGFEMTVKSDDDSFKMSGSGTDKGGKISGTFKLKANGVTAGTVELADFDSESAKKGFLNGKLSFKPASGLLDEIPSYNSALRSLLPILSNMTLELELENSEKSGNNVVSIQYDGDPFVKLTLKADLKQAKDITKPKDSLEPDEWVDEIDPDKVEKLLDDLESKSDIPSEYLDSIRSTLKYLLR